MQLALPQIVPLRNAQPFFGMLPGRKGPLWRNQGSYFFPILRPDGTDGQTYEIPDGYEFDKASIPPILWGPPLYWIPDGTYTIPALEHDFLCDLLLGGSDWLRDRIIPWPAPLTAGEVHYHFYQRLLQVGIDLPQARTMYHAVLWFGPGGLARLSTIWQAIKP